MPTNLMKMWCIALFSTVALASANGADDTIAHKVLALEAALPNRPNVEPELNYIIGEAVKAIGALQVDKIADEETRALATFQIIQDTLVHNGYYHQPGYYPSNLTDVLALPGHLFDCDTGSYIYISIAQRLDFPVAMVEIEVPGEPSGRGFGDHNFVRWTLSDGRKVDWDPNDQRRRWGDVEDGLYGYAWSENQLLGYVYFTRGIGWADITHHSEAIADYEQSIALFPEYPKARNNIAWLLSTKRELQSLGREADALAYAQEAVQLQPSPNQRDTLACAYAINGDFEKAVEVQLGVVRDEPADVFKRRLEMLQRDENCLGED